ncbi:MAG: hypothetical protein CM1200mP24_04780 [Gammaproteobacteria bacterium]|nr:MAG: hypothetical protein CM1200mP24_04780 [Gammaproteobacteria bacterium]
MTNLDRLKTLIVTMAKTKLSGTEMIPERKKQYLLKYSEIQLAAVMPFVLVGYMPKFQELPLETLFVWEPSLLPSPWSLRIAKTYRSTSQ